MNKLFKKILGYVTPDEYKPKTIITFSEEKSYYHSGTIGVGFQKYITSDYRDLARGAYKKNGLVERGIMYLGSNIASAPLKIYDVNTDKELPKHPLRQIIKRPNPYLTEYCFWERVVIYYYLSGNIFIEKIRDDVGRLIGLDLLRPDRVTIIPSKENYIDHYLYTIDGNKYSIEKNDIVHIYNYDPINDYIGFSPLEAAIDNIETDNIATEFTKNIFQNKGLNPGNVLFIPGDLTKEQIQAIRQQWKQNYTNGNQGGLAVFTNDAKIESKAFNFQELQFPELTKQQEARVLMVLGVPPMLVDARLGNEASTYNNVQEARTRFWEDTINPFFNKLDDHIQSFLLSEFEDSDKVYVKFDTTSVPAFASIRQQEFNNDIVMLDKGIITIEQFKEKHSIQ